VGKREAEIRAKKIRILMEDDDEFVDYLEKKTGKVVLGPEGTLWLIDGHHLATALRWRKSRKCSVEVKADWSNLS